LLWAAIVIANTGRQKAPLPHCL